MAVPQTRKRLIVRAVRGGFVPQLPAPVPWVGWYEAIEDLIPDLPESQFARWQLERLPEELSMVLLGQGGFRGKVAKAEAAHPALTVTGNRNQNGIRAFIVHQSNRRRMTTREAGEPVFTVMAGSGGNLQTPRSFLVDGKLNNRSTTLTTRDGKARSFTVTTSHNIRDIKGLLKDGRVVKMTPRALARFQSFPDTYELPDKATLACRIIGNAVPPQLMQQIYEGLTA